MHDTAGSFVERLIEAFERMLPYSYGDKRGKVRYSLDTDHFSFILYELFLYTIATLIRKRRFQEAAAFLEHEYVFETEVGRGDLASEGYSAFNHYNTLLEEYRKRRSPSGYGSETGHLISVRAKRQDTRLSDVVQADAVCWVRHLLTHHDWGWTPRCLFFADRHSPLELFLRATSPKGQKLLLDLLGAKHVSDVIDTFAAVKRDQTFQQLAWEHRIDIGTQLNLQALAKSIR